MKRLILILTLFSLPLFLGAQNSDQSKKARLEKEIAILDKQLKDNAKKSSSALSTLTLAHKKVSNGKKLVEESNRQINQMDGRILEKEKEIRALQQKLDTMSFYYGKLVRTAYRSRDSRIWFMYILSSQSLKQGISRVAYFKNLAASMNTQAIRIEESKAQLQEQKDQLISLRNEAGKLRSQQQKQLKSLKAAEAQTQDLVNRLKKDRNKYQKELASKRRQVEALNREVSKMISRQSPDSSKPVDVKLSGQFSANRGKLPWPVDGVIVDQFGQHFHPVYKTVKLPFNNGVNIATGRGAEVKAVFDGEVRQVIVMPGYNQCVLVQHGEYFTFYCKLGSVSVKAGDKIKLGQVIGRVDTISGETQLHFQLWEGKTPRDPEIWLR